MTTGERIKASRKAAGITQKQLADKMGIPYQGIGQWESGKRNPKRDTLIKIADILGVTAAYLSGDDSYLEMKVKKAHAAHDFQQLSALLELPSNMSDSEIDKAAIQYVSLEHRGKQSRMNAQNIAAGLAPYANSDDDIEYYVQWLQYLRRTAHDGKEGLPIATRISSGYSFSGDEVILIAYFSGANREGQKKIIDYARDLSLIPKYQKSPSEAQEAPLPSEGETTPENNKSPSEGQ